MIKVLVVDDHSGFRAAVIDVFQSTDDIVTVGECSDGDQVVDTAKRTCPEVVLMDLSMPRMSGLEATAELRAAEPSAKVVLLTGSFSATCAREARNRGAVGYLLKSDDPQELPQRVREVAAGGTAWSRLAAAIVNESL